MPKIALDPERPRNPWDRLPGETSRSYEAFQVYRDSGHERSTYVVAFKIKRHRSQIRDWCAKFQWVSRVKAWDAHVGEVQAAAKLKVAAQKAEIAAAAQWEEGVENRSIADKLRQTALDMLSRVDFEGEVTTVNGKTRRTGRTKWNLNTIAKFAEFASRIGQVGIGEMLAHLMQDDGFDPATATPDELRAFLLRHGVKSATERNGQTVAQGSGLPGGQSDGG